tara:strand:+ start:3474 stop:4214 length:741 start_codon:yes stop_codon:yes gene_type:complete
MFQILINSWIGIGIITFLILLFITAPYGRHIRSGWGPNLQKRFGWILMETPALYVMWLFYFLYADFTNIVLIIFLFIWSIHYINRSIIWPFLIDKNGSMPLVVAILAFIFNVFNASFHGFWFFFMDNQYDISWLLNSNFLIGLCIFILGMAINIHSDRILLNISKEEKGYQIPYGGFYKWVSSPNYFGEIIEWIGWAIMTWSLSGFVFALWTIFNLLPRALKHHSWYKDKFDNYPKDRKAIIPKIL